MIYINKYSEFLRIEENIKNIDFSAYIYYQNIFTIKYSILY